MPLGGTDGFEQMEKPDVSGNCSPVVWARVACGPARTASTDRTRAAVSGPPAGALGIEVLRPGMEDRQRRAHELGHLPLRRDATGIERAGELRLPERKEPVHVADMLALQR